MKRLHLCNCFSREILPVFAPFIFQGANPLSIVPTSTNTRKYSFQTSPFNLIVPTAKALIVRDGETLSLNFSLFCIFPVNPRIPSALYFFPAANFSNSYVWYPYTHASGRNLGRNRIREARTSPRKLRQWMEVNCETSFGSSRTIPEMIKLI